MKLQLDTPLFHLDNLGSIPYLGVLFLIINNPLPREFFDMLQSLNLKFLIFFFSVVTLLTACGGSSSDKPTPSLDSIQVTPTNPSIAYGTTQQLTATGTYSDGSTQDLTTQVTWSSSTTSVTTVSNANGSNGLSASTGEGETTISATMESISGSILLTVTPAELISIQVTPTNPSIAYGTTQQLTATGTYSDGSTQDLTTQVTWSSSTTSVTTVSNANGSNGLLTATGEGEVSVSASLDEITGNSDISVIFNPGIPISLSITATPNVILNNGTDASSLSVTVQPASSSGSIADGTLVDFSSQPSSVVNLNDLSVSTVLGQASNELTSNTSSNYSTDITADITAKINGTVAAASVGVRVVSNFSSVITKAATSGLVTINGYTQAGSTFSLTITNSSNREFELHSVSLENGGVLIGYSSDGSTLSDNDIAGGESVSGGFTLNSSIRNNGWSIKYLLSDIATGESFIVSYQWY